MRIIFAVAQLALLAPSLGDPADLPQISIAFIVRHGMTHYVLVSFGLCVCPAVTSSIYCLSNWTLIMILSLKLSDSPQWRAACRPCSNTHTVPASHLATNNARLGLHSAHS